MYLYSALSPTFTLHCIYIWWHHCACTWWMQTAAQLKHVNYKSKLILYTSNDTCCYIMRTTLIWNSLQYKSNVIARSRLTSSINNTQIKEANQFVSRGSVGAVERLHLSYSSGKFSEDISCLKIRNFTMIWTLAFNSYRFRISTRVLMKLKNNCL